MSVPVRGGSVVHRFKDDIDPQLTRKVPKKGWSKEKNVAVESRNSFSIAGLAREEKERLGESLRRAKSFASEDFGPQEGCYYKNDRKKQEEERKRDEKKTRKQLAVERQEKEKEKIRANARNTTELLLLNSVRLDDEKQEPENPIERKMAQMEAAAKRKVREQAHRKREEDREKRTRGIGNLRNFFGSGGQKWTVRDPISGLERPAKFDTKMAEPTELVTQKDGSEQSSMAAASSSQSQADSESASEDLPQEEAQKEQKDMRECFPAIELESRDEWVRGDILADEDEACAELLRRMCGLSFDFGCGNDPRCNAEACAHEEPDEFETPLESWDSRERTRTGSRRLSQMPVHVLRSPYNVTTCATADSLECVARRKRIGTVRAKPADNIDYRAANFDNATLQSQMTLSNIGAQVLRLRAFYDTELSNIFSAHQKRMATINAQFKEADNRALERNQRAARLELARTRRSDIDAQEHMFQQALAHLDHSIGVHVSNAVNSCAVNEHMVFTLPPTIIMSSLSSIVRLRDGANRDDAFYLSLVEDVCHNGRTDNLVREIEREQRLYASAAPVPKEFIPSLVAHRPSFSAPPLAEKNGKRNGKHSVHFADDFAESVKSKRAAKAAAVISEISQQLRAEQETKKRKAEGSPPLPTENGVVEEEEEEEEVANGVAMHLDAKQKESYEEETFAQHGSSPTDEIVQAYEAKRPRREAATVAEARVAMHKTSPKPVRIKAVAQAQSTIVNGQTACTPIALIAAVRLLAAHKSFEMTNNTVTPSEYAFSSVAFDRAMTQGASLWRMWRKEQENENSGTKICGEVFMTSREVLKQQPKIKAALDQKNREMEEFFGEWSIGSASEYAKDSELAKAAPPYSSVLEKCESLGHKGVYAGVLTVRGVSICVARVAKDTYFIFDSHGSDSDPEHATLAQYSSRDALHDATRALLGDSVGGPRNGMAEESAHTQYSLDVIYEKIPKKSE